MIIVQWKSPERNHAIYPALNYSTMVGIVRDKDFFCKNCLHDEYLVLYVTEGTLFCEQHGVKFAVEKNQYLLMDKRFKHTYYFDRNIPSEIYWMHIAGEQTEDMVSRIHTLSPLPVVGTNRSILEGIQTSMDYHNSIKGDIFSDGANITRILYHILRDVYEEKVPELRSQEEIAFCTEFERILAGSELAHISLDYICEKMHLSKFYFSHKFKEYYHVSPMKYINALKLENAKQHLMYTDMKISSIARMCGYSSNSHFTKVFRRECGMTPQQYRSRKD